MKEKPKCWPLSHCATSLYVYVCNLVETNKWRLVLEVFLYRILPQQNLKGSLSRSVYQFEIKWTLHVQPKSLPKVFLPVAFYQFRFEDPWSFMTFDLRSCPTTLLFCSLLDFYKELSLNLTMCFITYELLFCVYCNVSLHY